MGEDFLALDWEMTAQSAERFISGEAALRGKRGALVGISGGLDSAVVAALACKALGPAAVKGVTLPERDSDPRSVKDARAVAQWLGIALECRDLTGVLRRLGVYNLVPPAARFKKVLDRLIPLIPRGSQARYVRDLYERLSGDGEPSVFVGHLRGSVDLTLSAGVAFIHAKVRLRMVALYMLAEQDNRLLVGSANRSEWLTGLFVAHGDEAADAMPLLDLYKTQVYGLARHLGVPGALLDKAPSPDLLPGLSDEYVLGLPYRVLDLVLYGMDVGWDEALIEARAGATPKQVARVREMVRASEPMRRMPPYPRLRSSVQSEGFDSALQ